MATSSITSSVYCGPRSFRYHDDDYGIEDLLDEIKKEDLYIRRPDLEPSPSKRAVPVGIILIIFGVLWITMIFAMMYPIFGNAFYILGIICFPIPIIFIIIGILLIFNKKSGKLMFAIICIVFGLFGVITIVVSFGQREFVEGTFGYLIVLILIMIYGFFLFFRHIRK